MQRRIEVTAEKPFEVVSLSNGGPLGYVTILTEGEVKMTNSETESSGPPQFAIGFMLSRASMIRLRDWLVEQNLGEK